MSPQLPASKMSSRQNSNTRSRSSLACHTCRMRKIRCDVENLPAGSTCTACKHSNSNCQVNVFSDRRRHGSRQHLATLQNRILELEALVQNAPTSQVTTQDEDQSGSKSPSGQNSTSALPSKVLGSPEVSIAVTRASAPSRSVENFGESILSQQDGTGTQPIQEPTPLTLQDFSLGHSSPPRSSIAKSVIHNYSLQDNVQVDGIILNLSMGDQQITTQPLQIADSKRSTDGAYFGPICPLHVSSPSESRSPGMSRQRPGVHIDMDSPRLKSVLIDSYCRFQRCTVDLVHRDNFLSHRELGLRSHYYSPFLESSVLCCSARLSTSSAVRSLSSSYARRAKLDLVSELEDPNLATLQGMLLLSDYEMSEGHDRVGWIYCGIACRLLIDLGLHKELSEPAVRDMNEDHVSLRASVTAGCLVYESLWSFYLGRPSALSLSGIPLTYTEACASNNATLRPWLDLCVSLSEITALTNNKTAIDKETIARLSELELALRHWHQCLPASIAMDEDNITSLDSIAYGLHMQYFRVQILLHSLPSVTSRKRKHGQDPVSSPVLNGWTPEASQQVLHHNAAMIIQLAITYREIFGLESTASIVLDNLFVGATAMISHIRKSQHTSIENNDVRWLELADEMLEALQIHYYITSRMRRTLACLVEDCPRISYLFSTDHTSTSPSAHVGNATNDTSQGAWGSYESVMNDFIFDPELLNISAFTDAGDLSSS